MVEGDSSAVEITLIGDVDVHSFREEKNYVIDVSFQQSEKPSTQASPVPQAPAPALPTAPPPVATGKPAEGAPASRQAGETAPPSADKLAQPANTETRLEEAPKTPPAAGPAKPEHQSKEMPPKEMPSREMSSSQMPSKEVPPKEMSSKEMPEPAAESSPKMAHAASESAAETRSPPPEIKVSEGPSEVTAERASDRFSATFSFPKATPAALFRRADAVWLVFDATRPVDIEPIRSKGGAIITDVKQFPLDKGQAIRIRLSRPQLPALTGDDKAGASNWTVTFADTMQTPTQPLVAVRSILDPIFANVTVPLPRSGLLHRLVDPDAGDTLQVITALPPARGFIKRQEFVEFSLLESLHGVAVRPNSDDVTTELASDNIVIARPGGLTLSPVDASAERATTAVRLTFDAAQWQKDRNEVFTTREDELVAALAAAEPDQRTSARVDLARFYMARGMYPEAKSVLDLALADSKSGNPDSVAVIAHAVAAILMGRPEQGLKDLASPAISTHYDSQLWKAFAYVRQEKWADAREKFKNAEFAITSLPIELQAIVVLEAMRASIEVRDFAGAAKRASELEIIGVPSELKPAVAVLRGRLAEALGHDKDALDEYGVAIKSSDRAAGTEAKLFEISLRQRRDEITQMEMLRELETLSVTWRGDSFEIKTLQMMARIYIDLGRYKDAFTAFRLATRLQPNSEASRQGQDAAAALFSQLFLSPKGDDLPAVEALAMFYEYRELTPIGRRGDEMIRRLADRLVAVDLLDQASELLQYQVDRRLDGAARAQVAARLAMIYLMNRKPDRAIAALRTTRIADLSGELRQ
ncbi:MAG TPA: tetratricopeptide repeat protein, partial [Bradyrhizobium sp.]|nr:tetratricopeptide repeat protein [Bradyrhizobium sp.]